MARETAREVAIQDATETTPYQDQRQIVRGLGAHLGEMWMAQAAGAGGAGCDIEGVPFEPALVEIINQAGATPAWSKCIYPAGGSAIGVTIAAAAAAATAPTLTQAAEGDWDIAIPTALAPDGETVTVIVYGFRDVASSL